MELIIDNINFNQLESEKYWSFPASYKGNKKEDTKQMILSGEYIGSRKMDGAYYRFVKSIDGEMKLQGRTRGVSGDFLNKINHVPHLKDFFDNLPNGTCFLGELYFPNNEGSKNVTTIMGCSEEKAIQRQKTQKLHYYIFDIWAYNGVNFLKTPIVKRVELLHELGRHSSWNFVDYALYMEKEELWEDLNAILEDGGEGVVITKKNSVPEPGKRTSRKTLKIKKEISEDIDCFLTGRYKEPTEEYFGKEIKVWPYWKNLHTNEKLPIGCHYEENRDGKPYIPVTKPYYFGWASAIEIGLLDNNGKVVSLGWISGITDEVKAGIVENNSDWKHKVVRINAMEIDVNEMTLRHGRITEWRDDKNWDDCKISQIK